MQNTTLGYVDFELFFQSIRLSCGFELTSSGISGTYGVTLIHQTLKFALSHSLHQTMDFGKQIFHKSKDMWSSLESQSYCRTGCLFLRVAVPRWCVTFNLEVETCTALRSPDF